MTWFRVGGAGIPATLKNAMNAVFNKKFGTSGQNYPPKQWPDEVNLMGPLPEGTASGQIANFTDGADDVPTKSLVVTIPSSLSGVSSVTEKHIPSRNMASMSNADFTLNSVRYKTANGVLYIDGTSTGETSSNNDAFKALDFWLPSGTYYFNRGSLFDVSVATYLKKYDDKSVLVSNQGSFTLSEKAHLYIGFYVYNKVFSDLKATICINLGSTAITYEDTAPITQYTASLGRTIYGGQPDIVNGEGTESYGRIIFDGSNDEVWQKHGSIASWFYIDNAITDGYVNSAENDFMICNLGTQVKYASVAQLSNGQFAFGLPSPTTYRFVFKNTDFTEVADFKEWLSNNNMQVVYKLATPTDFAFTGQEVPTRLGYNAFWSDEGDTEVTYRRDIDLALQALQGSRSLSASLMRSACPEEVSEPEENIQNTEEEQEGEDDAR